MQTLRLALAALLLCLPVTAAAADAAPDFTLRTLDGRLLKLSDETKAGKVVVVSFWATWCGPCLAEMPHLDALQKQYPDQMVVLSISIDDAKAAAQVRALARRNGYSFAVMHDTDSKVIAQYNPQKTLPYTVVVDRDGRIAWVHAGFQAGDETHLAEQVGRLLGTSPAE